MSEVASPKVYGDTNWTMDVSNGYNPTTRPDYGVQQFMKQFGYTSDERGWSYSQRYADWRADQIDRYNDYIKAYDTTYNNEYNTTQRQIDSGYNPYYLNASTASQHSAASGPTTPVTDPYKSAQLGLENRNQVFDFISKGVQTAFDAIGKITASSQQIANLKKTNVETDILKHSAEGKILQNNENGYAAWLKNNIDVYSQFGDTLKPRRADGTLGGGTLLPRYGMSGTYLSPDEKSPLVKSIQARSNLEDLNYQKLFSLLKGGVVEKTLQSIEQMNRIREYDAVYSDKLVKELDDHIIPAIISGADYEAAYKSWLNSNNIYKKKEYIGMTREVIGSISDVIGSIAKIKGVSIQSSQDALKWLIETGDTKFLKE